MSNSNNKSCDPLSLERVLRNLDQRNRNSNRIAYDKRERNGKPGYPDVRGSWPKAAAWIDGVIQHEFAFPGPERNAPDTVYDLYRKQFPEPHLGQPEFAWYFLTEAWHCGARAGVGGARIGEEAYRDD